MHYHYDLYLKIKEDTYTIFEIYHRQALSRFFKDEITLRDLAILRVINSQKNIDIQVIIHLINISYSNLSNRFAILEKNGLIVRNKDTFDSRKTSLSLTSKGSNLVLQYQKYQDLVIDEIKRNLTPLALATFVNFLIQLHNDVFSKESKLTKRLLLKYPKNIQIIFDEIQDFFIGQEQGAIENDLEQLPYEQILILSEMYLNQLYTKLSLPQLSSKMLISYQTLVSKIKKFISLGYLEKNKNRHSSNDDLFNFSLQTVHNIDMFISSRIINYLLIMKHSTPKEEDLIIKVFQLFKTFSLRMIKQ